MYKITLNIIFVLLFGGCIYAQSFKEKLDLCLNQKFKDYSRFEYEILNMPKNNSLVEILEDGEFKLSGNLYYVPVYLLNKQSSVKSFIQLRVKLYKDVFYASRDLVKNLNFTNIDLDTKNIDVTQLKSRPEFSLDKILSSRSKLFIKSGEIIFEEMVSKIPVIFKDNQVKASLIRGNIEISINAISKQEGCIGDIISVQTIDKKRYSAKVIDKNNVNIIE